MKRKSFIGVMLAAVLFVATLGLIACGERNNAEIGGTHTHTYAKEWTYDNEFHWHKATCEHTDEINGRAAHSFENNECTICHYKKSDGEESEKVYKTVSFDLNGGNGTLDDMQFAVGEVMAMLPSPTRDEYKFICWQDALGNEYTAASVMGGSDLHLTAKWQKVLRGYTDEYVSLRPASEGYKNENIYFDYSNEVDKFVYVEITSDNLKGKPGAQYNFDLKSIDGMEYAVESGYTWTWYQSDFQTPNGAQRFTLDYGSNIQFLTVSDGSGIVMQSYLLDIYVKHDYYIKLYDNIFASEAYDSVRVIENERFSADTEVKESDEFEFDARVYYNEETNSYEKFVYSTAITKNWNLYQTYKPVTVSADADGGTLDGSLVITPYTQYFTLPSPVKTGYDFLGWQTENGEYLTNVQGYSGVNYISEENNPAELTAVYAKKKYYYTFYGDTLKTQKTVPVVTYTDETMRTILDITYVPYDTDCVLPVKTAQGKGEIFTEWQCYYKSDKGVFGKSLSAFDFGVKITSPVALAPATEPTSDYAVPLNGELTSHNTGTYKMYLLADKRYTLTVSTTGSVRISINKYGATENARTLTVNSDSPAQIDLDYYVYNLGQTVYSHGYVTFTVTSLTGSFTARLTGDTAITSGTPVMTNDDNTAEVGEKFSVKLVKPGYAFEGWYEGENKISEDQSVTMEDAEKEITAKWFACPVTLERSIPDAGSVSGLSGTTVIGEDVTVTATTNAGYTWVGWTDESGEIVEAEQSFTFAMPAENVKYIAKWIKVTAERNNTSAGSVTQPSGKYKVGDEATVTATTYSGYTWVGWADEHGEIIETNLSYTFTMPNESAVYTATWAKLTLGRNDTSAGKVSALNGKYTAGQEVTVTATTTGGYTFLGWYDGEAELTQNSSYTFNMPSEDATYTAKWTYYTLTTEKSDSYAGSITTKNAVKTTAGTSVTLTATTNSGYTWLGWFEGDTLLSENMNYTFAMPAESVIYTAKWAAYTLTTATNDSSAGMYTQKNAVRTTAGQSVTITATTNSGYTWLGWYNGDILLSENLSYTFDMPAESVTYTAKWTYYTLSTAVNDSAAGKITEKDADKITLGESVTITAITNKGYTFVGWFNGDTKLTSELSYEFEMPNQNITYTAKWIKVTLAKSENGGTVSSLNSAYKVGDSVTVTATTSLISDTECYVFLGWYDGDRKLTENLSYTFTMPDENKTLTAKWSKFGIEANNTSGGSLSSIRAKYKAGERVTVTATTRLHLARLV